MRRDYVYWLGQEAYGDRTIGTQLSRIARVEEHYGDLDTHFDVDRLEGLLQHLAYSSEDERRDRPNPTQIPIVGNIRNNLASYKSSVSWYRRFRDCASGVLPETKPRPEPGPQADVGFECSAPRRTKGRPAFEPRVGPRTLVDFDLNGRAAIQALIASSQYRTVAQTVAALTLFSHPKTVSQTGGRALFPSIRNPHRVGQIDVHEGRRVLLDDNKTPTDAFLWANGLSRRGLDTQFNHIYAASRDPDAYTALPNICMTPAFIAKLTDTDKTIRRLLMYRSYQLYGWTPAKHDAPERPEDYETLEWAAPLPQIDDVRAVLTAAMAKKPKNRTVLAAAELGWLFGEATPHASR